MQPQCVRGDLPKFARFAPGLASDKWRSPSDEVYCALSFLAAELDAGSILDLSWKVGVLPAGAYECCASNCIAWHCLDGSGSVDVSHVNFSLR